MEFASFTGQFCAEHQERDTPRAADAAAVWHLFDAHADRWFAGAGDAVPADPPPTRLGQRLVRS